MITRKVSRLCIRHAAKTRNRNLFFIVDQAKPVFPVSLKREDRALVCGCWFDGSVVRASLPTAPVPFAAPCVRQWRPCRDYGEGNAQGRGDWTLEIIKRSDTAKEREVWRHRWVVEQTFAQFGQGRRLAKDWSNRWKAQRPGPDRKDQTHGTASRKRLRFCMSHQVRLSVQPSARPSVFVRRRSSCRQAGRRS